MATNTPPTDATEAVSTQLESQVESVAPEAAQTSAAVDTPPVSETSTNAETVTGTVASTDTGTEVSADGGEIPEADLAAAKSPLKREMELHIAKQEVEDATVVKLRQVGQRAKIQGFRPGKVPPKILRQYYGAQVTEEVIDDLINKLWQDTVKQNNLKVAGEPSVKPAEKQEDGFYVFVAEYEVYPEFDLVDFSQQQLDKVNTTFTEEDIDRTLERMRLQQAEYVDSSQPVANHDQVNVDYAGTLDGEAFEGGSAQSAQINVGSHQMLPEFEQGIIGMQCGESKTVAVPFPDNYPEKLRGKTAQFEIKVNSVKSPILPEFNADFIKKLGVSSGDMADLRREVTENVKRELTKRINRQNAAAANKFLLEKHQDFPVPIALNVARARELYTERTKELQDRGVQDPQSQIDIGQIFASASNNTRLELIVNKIVELEPTLPPNDAELRQYIEEEAKSFEFPEEVVNWFFESKERLNGPVAILFERKMTDWVFSKVQVNEKNIPFEEMMGIA